MQGRLSLAAAVCAALALPAAAAQNTSHTPGSFSFTTVLGTTPPDQTATLTNNDTDENAYAISADEPWVVLGAAPASLLPGASGTYAVGIRMSLIGAPGPYNATITFTVQNTTTFALSVTSIPVTLVVNPQPTIGLFPPTLAFAATQGGPTPANQGLTLLNIADPASTLNYAVAVSQPWIAVSPLAGSVSGGASATLTVSADPSGLPLGTHSATITVSDATATNTPQAALVSLVVSPRPVMSLGSATLSFNSTSGANPPGQTVTLTNAGPAGSTLNFSASSSTPWIFAFPSTGSLVAGASQSLLVLVDTAGLSQGAHAASLTISDPNASNSPEAVSITLNIAPAASGGPPQIALSPLSLTFQATEASQNPLTQVLTVTNSGGGTLSFAAADDAAWLDLTPPSGQLSAGASSSVSVAVNLSSLAAGAYSTTITVTDPAATNNPQSASVTLTVLPKPALAVTDVSVLDSTTEGLPAGFQLGRVAIMNTVAGSAASLAAQESTVWLSVDPPEFTLTGGDFRLVNFLIQTPADPGTHPALVQFVDPAAANAPEVVVSVKVHPKWPVGDQAKVIEDFEADPASTGWTLNGFVPVSSARVGPWNANSAFTGAASLMTTGDAADSATSPSFDISAGASAWVSFMLLVVNPAGALRLQVSGDGFQTILLDQPLAALAELGAWQQHRFSLAPAWGLVRVRLQFTLASSKPRDATQGDLFIDDFRVGATPKSSTPTTPASSTSASSGGGGGGCGVDNLHSATSLVGLFLGLALLAAAAPRGGHAGSRGPLQATGSVRSASPSHSRS